MLASVGMCASAPVHSAVPATEKLVNPRKSAPDPLVYVIIRVWGDMPGGRVCGFRFRRSFWERSSSSWSRWGRC